MTTAMTWQITSTGSGDTERLGQLIGKALSPPALLELSADLGGGKTTFVRGLARGLGSSGNVSSPTFTLNKVYKGKAGLEIHHFDFYRLNEPGVVADQLAESLNEPNIITVVEWSNIVKGVLPDERLTIKFEATANDPEERLITINYPEKFVRLIRELETQWTGSRP